MSGKVLFIEKGRDLCINERSLKGNEVMGKYDITKIECPKCHKEQSKRTWKNINIKTNPDLKEKVLNRSLFKFTCNECGYEALLDYSLIYEDDYRIYYVTTQEELDEVMDLLSSVEERVEEVQYAINRVVCSQDDLFEKIEIFELGLDDRIIEIIKVLFYMNFKQQRNVEIDAILFKKEENSLSLHFMNQGFEEGKVEFDMNLYAQVKEKYEIYMEQDVRIDFDWASSVIMNGQNKA